MRASSIFACGAGFVAAVTAVACAASEAGDENAPEPDSGGSVVVLPDGGAVESDADLDASVDVPRCSTAGWCATSLPDMDLNLKDISVFEHRAFAVAESPTLGIKLLEWDEAEDRWKYIDDGSQNEFGIGGYVANVWAPNEDEVYYGIEPGYVYHGKRPVPPETAWSWTRHRLRDDNGEPAILRPNALMRYAFGVWGTSSSDVYAWFGDRIYHWKSVDGGAPDWALEYVADDVDNPLEFLLFTGAGGTDPGSVWFSGSRTFFGFLQCGIVVHKTASDYRRVADGVHDLTTERPSCQPRAGTLKIGGADGWLRNIQVVAPDTLLGIKEAPWARHSRDVVKISAEGDSYSAAVATVPKTASGDTIYSLAGIQGDLWVGGWGRVLRGTDVWDGGQYEFSSVMLQGPLDRAVVQIRGTASTNMWAIGDRYALHKTTP